VNWADICKLSLMLPIVMDFCSFLLGLLSVTDITTTVDVIKENDHLYFSNYFIL